MMKHGISFKKLNVTFSSQKTGWLETIFHVPLHIACKKQCNFVLFHFSMKYKNKSVRTSCVLLNLHRLGSYLSSFVSLFLFLSLSLRFSGFYQSIEYRLSLCHFRRHNWIVLVLIHCHVGTLKINRHVPAQSLEFLELICAARVRLPCTKGTKRRKEGKHFAAGSCTIVIGDSFWDTSSWV